ncbi:hypothetical protein SAY87_015250 [Trapa incisa]|uniref:Uncharacterized protein n=1 Tax=Trapa incisa TaxID=236973 RepID=A0AAN7H0U7_9MYRT|nr:hypothetical protein SAY87_015250 [Trapa incisa]
MIGASRSIPSNHLHNFEHSLISISFFTYAVVALIFDRAAAPRAVLDPRKARAGVVLGLNQLVVAVAFSLQLLFHLHSTDHMGLEGQYHLLLQVVIIVSLTTTLIGIGHPRSFLRCFLNGEDGYFVVRCHDDEALHRAKGSYVIGATVLSISLYLVVTKLYGGNVEYQCLDTWLTGHKTTLEKISS